MYMIRRSNSCEFSPANCHTTEITGISMDGKISVGVRIKRNGVARSSTSDNTTKVYGRRKAKRTIHIKKRKRHGLHRVRGAVDGLKLPHRHRNAGRVGDPRKTSETASTTMAPPPRRSLNVLAPPP